MTPSCGPRFINRFFGEALRVWICIPVVTPTIALDIPTRNEVPRPAGPPPARVPRRGIPRGGSLAEDRDLGGAAGDRGNTRTRATPWRHVEPPAATGVPLEGDRPPARRASARQPPPRRDARAQRAGPNQPEARHHEEHERDRVGLAGAPG